MKGSDMRFKMPDRFIKQYGSHRAGTSITAALIDTNFQALTLVKPLGEKHAPPEDFAAWISQHSRDDIPVAWMPDGLPAAVAGRRVPTIVTIKPPHAWLWSLIRSVQRMDAAFLVRSIEDYNRLNKTWHAQARFVLLYDRFINDPYSVLAELGEQLELEPTESYPNTLEKLRLDGRRDDDGNYLTFDPSYYRERRYLNEMPSGVSRLADEHFDWVWLGQFGWQKSS